MVLAGSEQEGNLPQDIPELSKPASPLKVTHTRTAETDTNNSEKIKTHVYIDVYCIQKAGHFPCYFFFLL